MPTILNNYSPNYYYLFHQTKISSKKKKKKNSINKLPYYKLIKANLIELKYIAMHLI